MSTSMIVSTAKERKQKREAGVDFCESRRNAKMSLYFIGAIQSPLRDLIRLNFIDSKIGHLHRCSSQKMSQKEWNIQWLQYRVIASA